MTHHDPGHTVLAVPVPELNDFVRARTAHYDQDYVAEDPRFGQAHITVLAPWIRHPTATDLAAIAQVAARTAAFEYLLSELDTFPNGIIHLVPQPVDTFAAFTAAVVELFPDYPPYAGQFPRVTPHVTLDAVSAEITQDDVRLMLGDLVPLTAHADCVQLQWWQAGHCHVQHTWQLGHSPAQGSR